MSKLKRGFTNLSFLSVGMVIKTVIGFFGIVYIARLLGPELYGIYVIASTFVSMFTIIGLYGIQKVVIREGSRHPNNFEIILEDNFGMKNLFLIIAVLICCVAALFTNYETSTKLYIFVFSLSIWIRGSESYISTVYQVTEKMKYISIFEIIETSLFVFTGIVFIRLGFGVFSLVIISAYTPAITLLLRYVHSKKIIDYKISLKPVLDSSMLKSALIFSSINFMNLIAIRIDILMISFLDSSAAVGIYGVAFKIVNHSLLLKNAIAVAFFPIAIKTLKNKKIKGKVVLKFSLFFSLAILGLSIIAFFFVTDLVVFLYGMDFEESGKILGILIFYLVFWWSTLPFTTSLKATGNEIVIVYCMALMAAMNIPLNYVLWHAYGLIGIAYSTLIVWSTGSILLNFYSFYLLKKKGHFR